MCLLVRRAGMAAGLTVLSRDTVPKGGLVSSWVSLPPTVLFAQEVRMLGMEGWVVMFTTWRALRSEEEEGLPPEDKCRDLERQVPGWQVPWSPHHPPLDTRAGSVPAGRLWG